MRHGRGIEMGSSRQGPDNGPTACDDFFVKTVGSLSWCGFMGLEDVRHFWNEAARQERYRLRKIAHNFPTHWRVEKYLPELDAILDIRDEWEIRCSERKE